MIFWRVLREGWASEQCQDILQGQWPGPRWGPGSQGQVWHRGREVGGGRRPEAEGPQHLRPLWCRGRELRGGLRGLWQHPPLPEVQECGECRVSSHPQYYYVVRIFSTDNFVPCSSLRMRMRHRSRFDSSIDFLMMKNCGVWCNDHNNFVTLLLTL